MPPTPLHEQILRMRFGKGEPPGLFARHLPKVVEQFGDISEIVP